MRRRLQRAMFKIWMKLSYREVRWFAMNTLARHFSIDQFVVDGDFGEITSSIDDGVVLMFYALYRTWSPETVKLFRGFFGQEPGSYLDIGANIGLTTIPLARGG